MQPKSFLMNQISVNRTHIQKLKSRRLIFYQILKNLPCNSVFGKFVNTTTFAENLGVDKP
jgi:hypothetical protein